MDWYIATTKPQCEARAIADMAMAGLMVFMPVARVEVYDRRMRRNKIRSFPLFNRYVFMGLQGDEGFSILAASQFITGILGNGGKPSRIAEQEVLALQEAQKRGAFNRKLAMKNKVFAPGEPVMVAKGVLTGYHGVIVSLDGKKAVARMAGLMGMMDEVKISVDDLRKVA